MTVTTKRPVSSVGEVLAQSRALASAGRIPWHMWREIVGSRVAERSRPERVEQGVLWVTVSSTAWAQELSMLRKTIIGRLKASYPDLDQVRFGVGPVRPLRPPAPRTAVARQPLPSQLETRLALVDDPELRRAIADAAGYHLGLARRR